MKPKSKTEKTYSISMGVLFFIGMILLVVAACVACELWGVESDPWAACAVDAPMEQSHCRALRAQGGER
jgi:hypothetical protein